MTVYGPDMYDGFPHDRYVCAACGDSAIAVGWEVETVVCAQCETPMEWVENLHDPLGNRGGGA